MTYLHDVCFLSRTVDCGRTVCFSLDDVNPARAEHDLVMASVNNLPDTQFTNDRHFLSSCLLDKGVVEQLATRVIDEVPAARVVRERCLGLFTQWLVKRQSRARLQQNDRAA